MKVLKFLDRHFEEILMVLSLTCIIVVMLFQIVRRYVFNNSLTWSEEFCRYCYIWMMFVAFSYSIHLKADLRVDAVVSLLPQGVKAVLELITLLICLAITGFLFYHSFGTVAAVVKTGEKSAALHLPMQVVYTASVVGYGCGTLRYIQRLIGLIAARKEAET
ncbi:MAG: TRAP transporter small permease [Lawsonibacter sp.]|jgi:TRAP-type C4-dicarboxylate transport system permease small subunit|nr:TRAP transporter small permease [Lawsonibacter sp.]MDE6898516.1 TRAP transporter small permease [Lawsonibacter sp.]